DRFETAAIKDVFAEHAYRLAVSSSKSMTGHMFGAAGAIEAMVCAKALETGWLPPTINYEHPDPDCDLDYVPNKARRWQPGAAMSNSFGLGGHNATVGGGIRAVADETETLVTKGWERVGPMMEPLMIANMASCQVSMQYGIRGPVVTNTAACAAGVYSLFEALHFLRRGDIQAAVTGGTESSVLPLAFISMARTGALSSRNVAQLTASRTFDKYSSCFG